MSKALILGSGGREHAFGEKLASEGVSVYFGPGNAGTRKIGYNLDEFTDLSPDRVCPKILEVCKQEQMDLVVVTGEDYLAAAVVNRLTYANTPAFGATLRAAKIESSKVWANRFLELYGIPHARGIEYFLPDFDLVLPESFRVVKADGLARGKGVRIAPTSQSVRSVAKKIQIDFPYPAERILVQEFLEGREVSAQAFSDGHRLLFLPYAVDHKRMGEDDSGDNTGGVATYSVPEPWFTRLEQKIIEEDILERLIYYLALNGIDLRGVVYGGIVLTRDGPKLIEVNARAGDPETQVILPRLQDRLFPILQQSVAGKFEMPSLDWDRKFALCVVLCSEGYPGKPVINRVVHGLNDLPKDILVFHGGTGFNDRREVITTSGRVLSVVALGDSLEEAAKKVYAVIGPSGIHFEGLQFRPNVGLSK